MEIKRLFENNNYVVLEKPSGLQVHPDGVNKGLFLTDWILKGYPECKDVGEPMKLQGGGEIKKPGIVHRLDRETSGAIVVCRNQKAFRHLKKQFKTSQVFKEYAAFVYGQLPKKGSIERSIGRSSKDFRLRSAQRGAKGKLRKAKTEYLVEKEGEKMSFLRIFPKTGRTHQIRVHMKAIHHPVVCDKLYAPNHDCLGFTRLALHARRIKLQDIDGKSVDVLSELPLEFKKAIEDMED